MIVFDYLIYIIHTFLMLLKKVNEYDVKGRAINALAIIIFFLCFLIISILYIILISNGWLTFSKPVYFLICIISFLIIFRMINRRYRNQYELIIEGLDRRFNYKKTTIVLIFLLVWFIPIFSFWGGILLFRQLLS